MQLNALDRPTSPRTARDIAAQVNNITFNQPLLKDIELIDVQALGGADSAVLNDVSGTRLKLVTLDLEAAIGEQTGGLDNAGADALIVAKIKFDRPQAVPIEGGSP